MSAWYHRKYVFVNITQKLLLYQEKIVCTIYQLCNMNNRN
jgi:hypothetical protein